MVQFDVDRDHLFQSDKGLADWCRPWSGGSFTGLISQLIALNKLILIYKLFEQNFVSYLM